MKRGTDISYTATTTTTTVAVLRITVHFGGALENSNITYSKKVPVTPIWVWYKHIYTHSRCGMWHRGNPKIETSLMSYTSPNIKNVFLKMTTLHGTFLRAAFIILHYTTKPNIEIKYITKPAGWYITRASTYQRQQQLQIIKFDKMTVALGCTSVCFSIIQFTVCTVYLMYSYDISFKYNLSSA